MGVVPRSFLRYPFEHESSLLRLREARLMTFSSIDFTLTNDAFEYLVDNLTIYVYQQNKRNE